MQFIYRVWRCPQKLGGSFSVILLVEELAKVDMSFSGFCDLQMVAVHVLKIYSGKECSPRIWYICIS